MSHDEGCKVRAKALGHIFDLLYQKPEQEKALLSQLVNKLGDPANKKVASRAVLFILKLCEFKMVLSPSLFIFVTVCATSD